jgi:hypothetical protein
MEISMWKDKASQASERDIHIGDDSVLIDLDLELHDISASCTSQRVTNQITKIKGSGRAKKEA